MTPLPHASFSKSVIVAFIHLHFRYCSRVIVKSYISVSPFSQGYRFMKLLSLNVEDKQSTL